MPDNVRVLTLPKYTTGILFNFGIGSPKLLPGHVEWLNTVAAPWLKAAKARRVALYGHASRSGDDTFNWNLSRARNLAVREHLTGQGVDPTQFEPDTALGERGWAAQRNPDGSETWPDGTENAQLRAVHVQLMP